ncbi:MAG: DUF5993 family protein [Parachlamydiaceae bacterium]
MMAALFAILALSLMFTLIGFKQSVWALWLIGTLLCVVMFFHHATDTLKILW